MISKKILISLLFFTFFLAMTLNGIVAYTFQIPLCNSSSLDDTCINFTSTSSITNAPINGIMFWRDGYLYLTNDTSINYTVYNNTVYNITNVTYQTINATYIYNISNGSTLTIIQNVTVNESIIKDFINSKLNNSFFNGSFYNKSETDSIFALKTEINDLKNQFANYASKNDITSLDAKYGYLLAINASGINGSSINLNELSQDNGLSMTWKVIIIINSIFILVLIIVMIKGMMSG